MRFVGGTSLSDNQLWDLSHKIVDRHGSEAVRVVTDNIDDASVVGDTADHAVWVNVPLGVLQILRGDVPRR